MVGAICASNSVAQAQDSDALQGQWYKSYEATGTGTASNSHGSFTYNFADSRYEGTAPNPNYSGISVRNSYPNDASMTAENNNGAASAKLSGVSIKVKYQWIPDFMYGYGLGPYPQGMQLEDPDPKLRFLVRSSAGAGAGLQGQASASADGKAGIPNASKYSYVQTQRLFSFDTKGQTEFSATIPFSAEATLPTGIHQYGSASVNFDAYASIDDRSVSLSRAGANGESTTYENGVQVTHGDTIYTYYDEKLFLPSSVRNVPNDLTFSGACNGNWSLNGTTNWVVSGGGAFLSPGSNDFEGTYELRRTARLGSQGLTQGSIDETAHWVGETTPETVTIKYFARDNSDGAEGEARYVLTLHDPIEKDHETTQSLWVYTPVWGSHVHGGDLNGVQKEYGPFTADGQNNPSVEVGHGTSRGSAQTLSGELGFEEVGAAFGYSYEWSQEKSNDIGRSVPININVPANYFTYPQFEDEYLRHNVFFRHFTAAGEHKLADVEFPPGSGYYDPQFHECEFDEPKGGRVMWAPPQPSNTGHIPNYDDPIEPTPNRSGGSS